MPKETGNTSPRTEVVSSRKKERKGERKGEEKKMDEILPVDQKKGFAKSAKSEY